MAVKATVAIVLGNEKDSNLLHSFQELLPGILQVSCMSVETLTNLVAHYFLGICRVAEILSNMNKVYSFDKTLMLHHLCNVLVGFRIDLVANVTEHVTG